jgi:hypothetical protein
VLADKLPHPSPTLAATADYDAALKINAKNPYALYGRGLIKLKTGDSAAADSDIPTAKAIQADIADGFSRYGLTRHAR